MEYKSEIPDQIRETISDRMPNNLSDDDFRLEYNNQNKGYLYFTIPEDDDSPDTTLSLAIRAVTSYSQTTFGNLVTPPGRVHMDANEYRILFSF